MKKRLAVEVTPDPELPNLDEILETVRVSDVTGDCHSRTTRDGDTHLTALATTKFSDVGRSHNVGMRFPFMAVKEGKQSGSLYLLPTTDKDPDRVAVHWYDAGREAVFSLNAVLRLKDIHIPNGFNLFMTCHPANFPGVGAALELRLSKARLKEIDKKTGLAKATAEAAATVQPEKK